MKLGIIGIGKMGVAIAHRVLQAGHEVFGYDPNQEALLRAEKIGVKKIKEIKELPEKVDIIWLMVPSGEIVDNVLDELKPHLIGRNILVDGGNSKFTDSIRRAKELEEKNIDFLDCGTSGGLRGEDIGFSLMVGGNQDAY